ncbi:MAG: CPBP family intramembrane metalloprotease [Acidobacteria bacterium]|nr:CPBP family intramembrane metalloprotease [Acidobacteriota bacterium]
MCATIREGRNVAWDFRPINEARTSWGQTLVVVGTCALLSALAMVLDWRIRPPGPSLPPLPLALVVFFAVFCIMAAFAVWTATSLGLLSFLLLSRLSVRRKWLRFAVYGVGAGFLIYLTNELYLAIAGAPFRPGPVYNLDNHLKVFTLSARAAFSEETMFRLFAIPFLVSLGMRFYGWRPRFGFESAASDQPRVPTSPPKRLVLIALLVSALMFGVAHGTNPVAASLFGLVLGVAFLRGGWESAVTAHFLGNYLLFAGIYL